MITFQTTVRVTRPIEDVFAFVSNPLLFPQWNSAVQTVHDHIRGERRPGLDILDATTPTEWTGRESA